MPLRHNRRLFRQTDCVYSSDVDLRRELLSAVILTGGLALMPGLAERFSAELHSDAFAPCNSHSGLKARVVCPNNHTERRSAAWLGGSILASLGTFQELWISKQEYEEHGPDILERRSL
ncbi:actin-like family protein [Cyclospora cayetanensis]|uniref:Actin-like family protein n=1 Tax=Cyclospora cayetanensis TaxID=88456 RepID=A0A1D3CZN5_9EIME|nr:actin-like family protein [Cyclospora cayetanensis]